MKYVRYVQYLSHNVTNCLDFLSKNWTCDVLHGAGMLHLCELQVLCCVCVVERDREVVGKLACC